jgi:DnaJ-class molecular chaperone
MVPDNHKMGKKKYRFFSDNVYSEAQAKLNYKRLALLYHPDRGGSEELMSELNEEYRLLQEELKTVKHTNAVSVGVKKGFYDVKIGDTVYVNGTECKVIGVFAHSFLAQAKGRMRTAVFDKKTGESIYTRKKYFASWKK